MKHYPQWGVWYLLYKKGDPKPRKIPVGLGGQWAKPNDSTTWVSYDDAVAMLESNSDYLGLAFFFAKDDPLVFIDVDDCLIDGEWHPDATTIVQHFSEATWETSQSGEGLHGIVMADQEGLNEYRNKWTTEGGVKCEFYHDRRFMALGQCNWTNGGFCGAVTHDTIAAIVPRYDGPGGKGVVRDLRDGPLEGYDGPATDNYLIKKACDAKGSPAEGFGQRLHFRDIWGMDVEAFQRVYPAENEHGYDWSRVDYCLMEKLAWWTGHDEARMDRLFRKSPLYREGKGDDYVVRTITAVTDVAEPSFYQKQKRTERKKQVDAALREQVQREVEANPDEFVPQPTTHDKNDMRFMMWCMRDQGFDIRFNEFTGNVDFNGRPSKDADDLMMWDQCRVQYGHNFGKEMFRDAIEVYAHKRPYNPVKDWLRSQVWDGTPRLSTWLTECFGVEDSPYSRAVGRAWAIAAVRRIMQPGCKFDQILIVEGTQGLGKSSAFAALVPSPDWFNDSVTLEEKVQDLIYQLQGSWIVEVPELSRLSSAGNEHVKAMLSRSVDKASLKYARKRTDWKRQNVFVGTTNDRQYLSDTTGNRRFWPVTAKEIKLDQIALIRDQLWAEAVVVEAAGEAANIPEALYQDARKEAAKRMYDDPYTDVLEEKLGDLTGIISSKAVFELLGLPVTQRRRSRRSIEYAMEQLGWEKDQRSFVKGDPVRKLEVVGGLVKPLAPTITEVKTNG